MWYIYIYIYIERERERYTYIYIYIYIRDMLPTEYMRTCVYVYIYIYIYIKCVCSCVFLLALLLCRHGLLRAPWASRGEKTTRVWKAAKTVNGSVSAGTSQYVGNAVVNNRTMSYAKMFGRLKQTLPRSLQRTPDVSLLLPPSSSSTLFYMSSSALHGFTWIMKNFTWFTTTHSYGSPMVHLWLSYGSLPSKWFTTTRSWSMFFKLVICFSN